MIKNRFFKVKYLSIYEFKLYSSKSYSYISEGIHSQCTLIIFNLSYLYGKNMFRKSITSLKNSSNSAFQILLEILLRFNDLMLPNNGLSFIINNVKGIKSYKKRLKLI